MAYISEDFQTLAIGSTAGLEKGLKELNLVKLSNINPLVHLSASLVSYLKVLFLYIRELPNITTDSANRYK